MKLFNGILRHFTNMGRVMQREFKLIFSDMGVLLFFFALPLIYPIVYTLIYNPEVVEKVPICVVDDSRSPQSRELVHIISACPAVDVRDYASNMSDAKELMASGDVFAILEIPRDYAKKLGSGEQATVPLYCDMTLLLRYRALLSAMTDVQIEVAQRVTAARVETLGASALGMTSLPVESQSHFLGDTQQGFASFVIPGIVILILQQSMILGVVLLGATSRERRRRNNGIDPLQIQGVSHWTTIWGKTFAYTLVYVPLTIYITRFIPEFFNLPHYGSPVDYLLFLFPLLLASAFLGQTLVYFAKERETTFIIVVFTSLIFLFLSGLTWPRYAMSPLWTLMGDAVPATWGVEGFVRINSNAATLAENALPYIMLWALTAVYCVTAWFVSFRLKRKP